MTQLPSVHPVHPLLRFLSVRSPLVDASERIGLHRDFALRGVSWGAINRMWLTEKKTGEDWLNEQRGRQIAIIASGLMLGFVVKTDKGFEVR